MSPCKEVSRFVKNTVGNVIPEPEDVWQRSGATMKDVEIDSARIESVPFFYDSRINSHQLLAEPVEVERKGIMTGAKYSYRFEMTTGISHDVALYLPTAEKQADMQFTVHMDAPFLTGVDGHNDRIAEAFMNHTDQPTILVGPEMISKHKDGLYIIKNLGRVAADSSQISLALAAQDSMQIAALLAELHVLPRQLIQVGESRAADIAPGKQPHSAGLDLSNVYYDLTDPSVAEHIKNKKRHALDYPLFIAGCATDMIPVGIDLLRQGSLQRERGTVPLKAEYLGAAALGTLRAFLGGEAGKFPAWLPADTPVHIANFKNNSLADHEIWRRKYRHTQLAAVNLNGAHLSLAHSAVQRHVIERINRYIDEYNCAGQVFDNMDFRRVHLKDDDRYIAFEQRLAAAA